MIITVGQLGVAKITTFQSSVSINTVDIESFYISSNIPPFPIYKVAETNKGNGIQDNKIIVGDITVYCEKKADKDKLFYLICAEIDEKRGS